MILLMAVQRGQDIPLGGHNMFIDRMIKRIAGALKNFNPIPSNLAPDCLAWYDAEYRDENIIVQADQYMLNGNFAIDSNADGLADNWLSYNLASHSLSSGIQSFTPASQYGGIRDVVFVRNQAVGDVVYGCAWVDATSINVKLFFYEGAGGTWSGTAHPGTSRFEFLSALGTLKTPSEAEFYIENSSASGFTLIRAVKMRQYNLTRIFGKGNEPTRVEMDMIIFANGDLYWDGNAPICINTGIKSVSLPQSVVNGSFENDFTGWTLQGSPTISTGNSKEGSKCLAIANEDGVVKDVVFPNGNKIHVCAWINITAYTSGSFTVGAWNYGTTTNLIYVNTSALTSGYIRVGIEKLATSGGVRVRAFGSGGSVLSGYVDGIMCFDKTAIFGKGWEPTTAQMNTILDGLVAYFDGTVPASFDYGRRYYWYDCSGHNRFMKLYNFAYTTASGWNTSPAPALDGDVTDDWIGRREDNFIPANTSFSYVACFSPNADNANSYLAYQFITDFVTGAGTRCYYATGQFNVELRDSDMGTIKYLIYTASISASRFYTLSYSYDISTKRATLYLQGIPIAVSAALPNGTVAINFIRSLRNAAGTIYTGNKQGYEGWFNRVLTNAEHNMVYNNNATRFKQYLTTITSAPYILDQISGSLAAYSLRKLKSTATYCMRVRRSSDSTEQDIGFSSDGLIDIVALITFVGSSTGYVMIWYDQTGNGNHATTTAPPTIMSSGFLNQGTRNIGIGDIGSYNGLIYPASVATSAKSCNVVESGAGGTIINDGGTGQLIHFSANGDTERFIITGGGSSVSCFINGVSVSQWTTGDVAYDSLIYGHNNIGTYTNLNISSWGAFNLGLLNWNSYYGLVYENIWFSTVLTSEERKLLESDQSSYYGITVS